MEHVRTRPGMYIGRLGDGSMPEDGIYVLLKEVIDNSIDEFKMNAGKRIEIDIDNNLSVMVRDYGRGIPQGKLIEAVSCLTPEVNTTPSVQEERRTQRCGHQGRQRAKLQVRGEVLPRRNGAHGDIRTRRAEERHDRGDAGRDGYIHILRAPTTRSSRTTLSTTTSWRRCCATTPT